MLQHEFCNPECIAAYPYRPNKHKRSNPLRIPLQLGWRRDICSGDFDDSNWLVVYRAPCGVRLR